jgi:hypothetical protein
MLYREPEYLIGSFDKAPAIKKSSEPNIGKEIGPACDF